LATRELVTFSSSVFGTTAVKKAAYKYIKAFSADITEDGSFVHCVLRFSEDLKADEIERIISDFRKEVLDQDLRESLRKETEEVRNLILAHAFSKTALVSDE
jgi:His-Xaa-Ser system protein HxsD